MDSGKNRSFGAKMAAHPEVSPTPPRKQRAGKVDVNHLLGFTLPPRELVQTNTIPRRSKKPHGGLVHDRRRYVHQFKVVLRPGKDYSVHFADPDLYFEWDDIWQIFYPVSSVLRDEEERVACPICLSEPMAARMTQCGHLFCYSCALHYLELREDRKSWRSCPVCQEPIHAKDLKPVRFTDPTLVSALTECDDAFRVPDLSRSHIKLRLIQKPQMSTLALPRSRFWPLEAVSPLQTPWEFVPDASAFAKFMLGSPEYMVEELESQLRDLDREAEELRGLGGFGGGTDAELGLDFVASARQRISAEVDAVKVYSVPSVLDDIEEALRGLYGEGAAENPQAPGPSSETSAVAPPAARKRNRKARKQAQKPVVPQLSDPSNQSYFFYQAASGQNIFLHPLDIKILKAHFGSYAGMPDTIEAYIDGADEGSMGEDVRRRCRWLGHVPLGADVTFLELDVSHFVPQSTLEPYLSGLKQRKQKRKNQERRADRARKEREEKDKEDMLRSVYGEPERSARPLFSLPEPYPGLARDPETMEEEPHEATEERVSATPHRSFAATLHSSAQQLEEEDPRWDERWNALEERAGGESERGGGRRARSKKKVVLTLNSLSERRY